MIFHLNKTLRCGGVHHYTFFFLRNKKFIRKTALTQDLSTIENNENYITIIEMVPPNKTKS